MFVVDLADEKVYALLDGGRGAGGPPWSSASPFSTTTPRVSGATITTIWVSEDDAEANVSIVYAYNRSDGSWDRHRNINLYAVNANPWGIWSDGVSIFFVDQIDGIAYAYRMDDDPVTPAVEALGDRDADRDITPPRRQ